MRCGIPHDSACKRPMTDIDGAGMSDNSGLSDMRDRIAAALRERVACGHGDTYETVADAVIAELGLSVTGGVIVGCLHE